MDLSNRKIKITDASTSVNSKNNVSRLQGQEVLIGEAVADFGDRIFYSDVEVGGELLRPMLYTESKIMLFDPVGRPKAKTIIVQKYEILSQ